MVTRFALDELDLISLAEGGVVGAQGRNSREDNTRDTEEQRSLDRYLARYSDKVEALFQSVANHTNGALAFYYRINPEISTAEKGFFYSRTATSAFSNVPLTDIGAYDATDIEHVGWYFLPIERGRPSWIAPYENRNLGVKMISYVAPLYIRRAHFRRHRDGHQLRNAGRSDS